MSQRRVVLITAGIMLSLFLASMEATVVATAMPTIVSQLGGLESYSWVFSAYMLASTTTVPLFGKLSDLYGRRLIYAIAMVLFLAGSLLCGQAQSMGQLIAFRAVQGLGGGGLIVVTLAVVGDLVSPRERGRYQGYFGAVFGVATVLGPLLGGFLVDNLSWRWIFYVNLPVGVAAFAVIARAFHGQRREAKSVIDVHSCRGRSGGRPGGGGWRCRAGARRARRRARSR